MKSGDETVSRAREAIDTAGLSQAAAAREIGISDSALSQWLAGKYEGDTGAVDAKVGRWLESRREREGLSLRLPDPPAWVETPTARLVIAGLAYAQMASDIAVIVGGSGCGKTVAARRYAGLSPQVWIATATAGARALGPCLGLVARACGLRPGRRPLARLESDICDRVRATGGLIVVDEAQHLSVRALDSIRGIHDATGTGVALLGGQPLYSRMAGRLSEELAQLHSRVGKLVLLGRPPQGDVDALLAAWGVDVARIRATAMQIAAHPGGLRGLTKAVRYAHLAAGGRKPGAGGIRDAWDEMTRPGRPRKKGG